MKTFKLLNIFKKNHGLITNSHVVLSSGKHSSSYLNKDALYPHTKVISLICKEIAKLYENKDIDAVVSPAIGGIILSQWTAYYLSEFIKKDVLAIYTEKDEDKNQIFTRGYSDLVFNKRILVVEDVITTGSSVIKTIQSIKKASGIVVAVCALVNRDPDHINSKKINFPFQSMADYKMESWEEKDCPLCIKGIKINTSVGHGKKYLENKGIKP